MLFTRRIQTFQTVPIIEVLKNVKSDVYIKQHRSNETKRRRKAVEKIDYLHDENMRQYGDEIIIRL